MTFWHHGPGRRLVWASVSHTRHRPADAAEAGRGRRGPAPQAHCATLKSMARLLTLLLLVWAAMAADRETIIFDTDSGLFGDDGASLVMLMRSPQRINIAGITVVPGNVWPEQGRDRKSTRLNSSHLGISYAV